MSIQRQIFQNIKTKLETLSWAKVVEFEKIRLNVAEFSQHEMPAIQIYDVGETAVNSQSQNEVTMQFNVELVMTSSNSETADQGLLFDRKLEIKRKIGEDPRLGITNSPSEGAIRHVQYTGSNTDFYTIAPHYIAVLNFQALFREPFVRDC